MIVWFNCKITDQRLNPQSVIRYHLKNDNRFDVARYSFASFIPLEPLVSKFIFNLELADEHVGREKEMTAWLEQCFPSDKLLISWHRANSVENWREVKAVMDQIDDDIVFPAGNEDHIFMDSNIEVFKRGIELIRQDPNPYAVLATSHFPETLRAASYASRERTDCGFYQIFEMPNNDAIRVMKKAMLQDYIDKAAGSEQLMFRTEHWNSIWLPMCRMYAPTKEQFRHFDGYAHVGIGPDTCPPLEIPPNFFEHNMTVRYGFADRQADAVNVNPAVESLYCADPNGTDYKYTLDELPAFWKPFTKETVINPEADMKELDKAYDIHLLNVSRIYFTWSHFNLRFDQSNWPDPTLLNKHTKVYSFTND